ncbi:unnamed protein product, partial [Mesorhabditis belari]|uniref:Rhodanese domain-containing protein n=1 Tax=Mesorhabditis belari TaxID=2138241 RepID=A0AAF3FAD0_9BILA
MTVLGKFVASTTLRQLVKDGVINKQGVRLLDCSFVPGVKPDWKRFKEQLYGKFEQLSGFKSIGRALYLAEHIPESVHADLEQAMYPGKFERFSHYPPEIFQEYARRLGIRDGEHLIFYGRGAYGGMLWPARFAWLFKSYGHEKVSVLDGGLNDWVQRGYEITTEVPKMEIGNWTARDNLKETLITFEELESVDGKYEPKPEVNVDPSDPEHEQKEKELKWSNEMKEWEAKTKGKMLIDQTSKINFLDTRPRAQFEGLQDSGLSPMCCEAVHIPGFTNTPVGEIVRDDGTIKDPEQIKNYLNESGFSADKTTITQCMTGIQASLMAYGIEYALPNVKPRVYNGSLKEMEQRDPKRISGGNRHIP